MENGGKKITKIKFYKCGYCVNNMVHILKKSGKKELKFPALVVFIQHQKYGNILYDTGYSKEIYNNGFVSKIYNLVNKTYVDDKDIIVNKLKEDNIEKIDKIILSHAHPDHIGCLNLLENYELLATKEVIASIEKSSIKNLVFRNMLPKDVLKKEVNKKITNIFLSDYFDNCYDILGDESLIGVKLNGHSNGQLGLYIADYNLFLVADSSWGEQFMDNVDNMKLIPKLIQNNFKEYKETIEKLKQIKNDFPKIKIIFSHGDFEEKEYYG